MRCLCHCLWQFVDLQNCKAYTIFLVIVFNICITKRPCNSTQLLHGVKTSADFCFGYPEKLFGVVCLAERFVAH